MDLQEFNREQLLYIIQEQNTQIHTLTAERTWLIEDNNLQREAVAKCQQKIAEWQSYAQYRKAQAEKLAQQVGKEKEKSEASLKSAVEELGVLKTEHLALLVKYETIKQQLDYGIHLGRAMYEEYLAYKTSYIALLQQFNTTKEDTEDSKITLQEQETPEQSMDNNAYAVVQYDKRKTEPPEAWADFIIIKVPSSAKIRLTVNIRSEPPSLHCSWRLNPNLRNPTKGMMLALPALVSNQDKVIEKRGLYEQKVCGVMRSPVKGLNTGCQNVRGTKSSSAAEHQKVDRPYGKVNRESSEILHTEETRKLSLKKKAQSVFHFLSLLKTTFHLDGGTEILLEFLE